MPEASSLFLLGVINGAAICSFSCLTYIGPLFLSSGEGFKDGFFASMSYLSGKIIVYTILSGFAAVLGKALTAKLEFSGSYAMGIALILMAAVYPYLSKKSCSRAVCAKKKKMSMFFTGVMTSFVPCPAIIGLFMISAENGSVITGLSYGFIYGMGLLISPLLPLSGMLTMISERIKTEVKNFAPYLNALSTIIVFILGVRMIINAA